MSWWWFPIEDGDAAVERQFQIQTFLHQVIDILNACVPLYNWYVETEELSVIPDYVVGTTKAQEIWADIQARIEILVGVFYDYDSIDSGEWFSIGSPDGPREAPGYMHYNVNKRFKTLARGVAGIPTAHLIRWEDEPGAGISHTITSEGDDPWEYHFAADIPGFKWDSVSVAELTRTYYEHFTDGNLDVGYYYIEADGENSEDGVIFFSEDNEFASVTINYKVDTTGFGWTRRVDDEDGVAGPPYKYADGPVEVEDVIHACLLNQIYACTYVLQDFAVIVNGTSPSTEEHSQVPGEYLSDREQSWETYYAASENDPLYYCVGEDGDPLESDLDACNKAKGPLQLKQADGGGAGTTCMALAANGSGSGCWTWAGNFEHYLMKVLDLPDEPGMLLNIKDFPVMDGPGYGFNYHPGVHEFATHFIPDAEYYKTVDVLEGTDLAGGTYTAGEGFGEGPPPVTVSTITCEDIEEGEDPPDFPSNYSAVGWVCIQQKIPDPTSSAP